jgi:ribosome biogenesis GTPase
MLSVVTGDGIDAVRAMVPEGSTVALTGPSGAGKSTLVNALLGEDRQATGAVRERDGRGRHVTVRRELITLPGAGVLIDTPGLRSIGVRGGVEDAFPDVAAFAGQCRFRDCAHESEPGCAVRAAIESGELDPERLRASRTLGQEAEYAAAREEELLRRALEGRPRTVDTADRGEHRRRRR